MFVTSRDGAAKHSGRCSAWRPQRGEAEAFQSALNTGGPDQVGVDVRSGSIFDARLNVVSWNRSVPARPLEGSVCLN